MAFLVVCCLLVLSSPPARGALAALAGLTKFGPLILAPLFAAGHGERRARPLILFALAFLAAAAVVTMPLLPDGGFRELYDRSLGYQASRGSPFSVWGQAPSLHFLQTVSKVFAVGLAALFFFVPRRRSTVQVAALAAALLIAVQVTANHWFYPYVDLVRPAGARGRFRPPARPRADDAQALTGALEGAAGGGRHRGVVALVADLLARQEVLDQQRALLGLLADVQQVGHRRDLLDLLLDEPGEELLGAEVARARGRA